MKLYLRQGYHQLALDPSTRKVATFSIPWGIYRPKRLVFGAKSSQDVFDEAMFRIFGEIHHCLNQRDDILLGGRDQTEHREVLKTVLKRARDYGITFNREKWSGTIWVFGHVFTKDGLKPSPDKVRAVRVWSTWEQRSSTKFPGNGRLLGQLHSELCSHSSTAVPANQERNQISLG